MEQNEIVARHMQSSAAVMAAGLEALRAQAGEEACTRVAAAIGAGATMQIVAALSVAGALSLSLNLIAPNGETVNIGHVEFGDVAQH